MVFYFEDTNKDNIMTEKDEEEYRSNNICRFCEKILNLIKLEIIVFWLVNTEVQLIINVILMLPKIKVILFQSYFITLVTLIVMCSLKNWLVGRMIKQNLILYLRRMKNAFQ